MSDGSGLGTLVPPLGSANYLDLSLGQVACKIKYGDYEGEDMYASFNPMPTFTNLSDTDISNLINFINAQWGHKGQMTSPQAIAEALSGCDHNTGNATK